MKVNMKSIYLLRKQAKSRLSFKQQEADGWKSEDKASFFQVPTQQMLNTILIYQHVRCLDKDDYFYSSIYEMEGYTSEPLFLAFKSKSYFPTALFYQRVNEHGVNQFVTSETYLEEEKSGQFWAFLGTMVDKPLHSKLQNVSMNASNSESIDASNSKSVDADSDKEIQIV